MSSFSHMNVREDVPKLVARLESAGDVDTLLAIVERGRNENYPPMVVRSLERPNDLLDVYVERVTGRGELLPGWIADTAYIKGRPDLMVGALHWSKLARLLEQNPSLVKNVEEALTGQLQDANTAWEALHTLSENFEGSLLDLVGAAQAL